MNFSFDVYKANAELEVAYTTQSILPEKENSLWESSPYKNPKSLCLDTIMVSCCFERILIVWQDGLWITHIKQQQ